MRDADAVQHVHKPGAIAIGHIGVPILTGIRAADVFAVFPQVRKDVDLGVFAGRVAIAGRAALNLAKLFGKALQRAEVEMLVGKAQDAIAAEPEQDPPEIGSA